MDDFIIEFDDGNETNINMNNGSDIDIDSADVDQHFLMEFEDEGSVDVTLGEDDDTNVDVFESSQWVDPQEHNDLTGRDQNDAHPISSITGLREELARINQHIANSDVHITSLERESWNNKSRVYRNASGALVISV